MSINFVSKYRLWLGNQTINLWYMDLPMPTVKVTQEIDQSVAKCKQSL